MLSPRWRKIWQDIKVNKTRTALVVMSIVVGIFAIGSISGTSAILNRESGELWRSIDPASGILATTVFDESAVSEIEAQDDVAMVQLRRSVDVRVALDDGSFYDLRLFSVPDYEAMQLNVITPEAGAWPPPEGEILIERGTVGSVDAATGEMINLELPTGEAASLTVAGEAYDLSQPSGTVLGTAYGYVTQSTMETLTGETGYNQLQYLVTGDAADETYVASVGNDIRDVMESSGTVVFTVVTQSPDEPPGYVFVVALLLVLGVIGSLTFLLSGFLIVNIMSALLTQQTKQIGVMKAMGARTGQITRMYLGLAAAFGGFALLIGLPLSFFGARGLTVAFGELNNYKITDFSAPWWVIALQVFIGLVVPVAAAMYPIYTNTRTTIREALDSRGIDNDANSRLNRMLGGMNFVPRPILLSFRNTFRQRGRLMLTLLTLTLAGAIFATVFTVRNSLYATLDDALRYDSYDVQLTTPQAYDRAEMIALAEGVESVENVEAWTAATGRYVAPDGTESEDIGITGITPDSQMIQPIVTAGRWVEDGDGNQIVINSTLADVIGDVAIGDTIDVIVRGETVQWEVVGIARAVFSLENAAWTSYEGLAATIGETGLARAVRLTTTESTEAFQNATFTAVNEAYANAGFLIDSSETRAALESSFDLRFNSLVFGLLALAGLLAIVGGLGIAGTTSINVIERTREIGVMRSIGAADYQVLGIFILEAVVVGAIGWVLGSLLALPISRLLSDGVGLAFSNAPLTYSFDVSGALLWLALAMFLAFMSSFFPARRASKLTLREVLAYEG